MHLHGKGYLSFRFFFVTHIFICVLHIFISELHVGWASWFVFVVGPEMYQTSPEFNCFYWRGSRFESCSNYRVSLLSNSRFCWSISANSLNNHFQYPHFASHPRGWLTRFHSWCFSSLSLSLSLSVRSDESLHSYICKRYYCKQVDYQGFNYFKEKMRLFYNIKNTNFSMESLK